MTHSDSCRESVTSRDAISRLVTAVVRGCLSALTAEVTLTVLTHAAGTQTPTNKRCHDDRCSHTDLSALDGINLSKSDILKSAQSALIALSLSKNHSVNKV